MINVVNYIDRLKELKEIMNNYIDKLVFSHTSYMRIITDKKIPFPVNYECIGHNNLTEVSDKKWNDTKGWRKPDIEFGGIELFYLWKQFKPRL